MQELPSPKRPGASRPEPTSEGLSVAAAPAPTLPARPKLDAMLAKEDYTALDTRSKVDTFLEHARKRYKELKAEDKRLMDADDQLPDTQFKALMVLENLFGPKSQADLESFYDGTEDDRPKAEAAQVAAPRTSRQAASAPTQLTATQRKEVTDYVAKVLGPKVKTAFEPIPHAGDYGANLIRVSVHALNPLSVGHHEAMHALFGRLMHPSADPVLRNTLLDVVKVSTILCCSVKTVYRQIDAGELGKLRPLLLLQRWGVRHCLDDDVNVEVGEGVPTPQRQPLPQHAGSSLVATLAQRAPPLGDQPLDLGGGLVHLLFQRLDEAGELLLGQGPELLLHLVALSLAPPVLARDR